MNNAVISRLRWSHRGPQTPVRVSDIESVGATRLSLELYGIPQVPSPHDKTVADEARFLLKAAAEIEHGLLVQYLYAGYSINLSLPAPVQGNTPQNWAATIRNIAIQEMDHLITVQNLLLALKRNQYETYFDRESFPVPREQVGLYPFAFRLEPMTGDSLSKYVSAESPLPETINDTALRAELQAIIHRAEQATGMNTLGHVGNIYAYLYWLFLPTDDASGPWPKFPADWFRARFPGRHLTTTDFADETELNFLQADPEEFHANDGNDPSYPTNDPGMNHRWVFKVRRAEDALRAIAQIAAQGEGTEMAMDSHFLEFLDIYRDVNALPAGSQTAVHLNVPTNPNLRNDQATVSGRIVNKVTRLWGLLCNTRYLMLLQELPLALSLRRDNGADGNNRKILARDAITKEMGVGIGYFARRLVTLPRDAIPDEKAGVPFELPDCPLPSTTDGRWRELMRLIGVTRDLLTDLRALTGPDKPSSTDEAKFKILEAVDADLLKIASTVCDSTPNQEKDHMPLAPLNSFNDVKDLFNKFVADNGTNIGGSPHQAFWNTDYDSFVNGNVPGVSGVKILIKGDAEHSNLILILRGSLTVGGRTFERMPADGPPFFSDDQIAALADWINRGCPNTSSSPSGMPQTFAPLVGSSAAGGLPGTNRVAESLKLRVNAAAQQAILPEPLQTPNSDETTYADKCGTYSKGLKQDSPGRVNLAAYQSLRTALNSGRFSDFENLIVGGQRTQNGPQGALAFDLEGADSAQFRSPPAPEVASAEYGTELIELYWASLLRDVPFTQYATNPIAAQAAAELSLQPNYKGPQIGGMVPPNALFRGRFDGDAVGPYLSQFFIKPTYFGQQALNQQLRTYIPGVDFMTDLNEWSLVQSGQGTGKSLTYDPQPRYGRNGRDLAAYTHDDVLYQAYFTAFLILDGMKSPLNPGNPYRGSRTENGFATLGGPDIAATLGEVATRALKAVWFQKWVVHLRHRPESGGGIVHLIKTGKQDMIDCMLNDNILNSQAIQASFQKYNSYLLSQTFPEGSPTHPAYPTGHGTVGGACITVLKFFYDGQASFPNPQVASDDGLCLHKYTGSDSNNLTVNGELNKLASNITFGHGIHAGIHWRSDSDQSLLLGEAVALSILQDRVQTYNEPVTVKLTKLDGTVATISNQ